MKTSLRYIHKLYLLNITDITQLSQNCGTKLMSIQDIQRQYGLLTRIILKIHQKLQILFCETTCTSTSPPTCPSHAPPLTLLQEFIILLQTPPTPPITLSDPATPITPSPQLWNQIKLTLPDAILAYRLISKKIRFGIIHTNHTYLCKWTFQDNKMAKSIYPLPSQTTIITQTPY